MEDNQGAIAIARNPATYSRSRTKHINIHYHFVCEAVKSGMINLCYCQTNEMVADLLTKPLPRGKIETVRLAMGIEAL